MHHYEGKLTAEGFRFGIIVARFNHAITETLLIGSIDCLKRHGAHEKDIKVVWVPGCFEIPLIAKRLSESGKFDAIICLGAVIRGATPHFEYVSSSTASGVLEAGLQSGIPVLFSVLTTDTLEQAQERAGAKAGNLGFNYALSAIEMVNLLKDLSQDNL